MNEYRRSTVAVWPVAADISGFWSLSGGRPWMPTDATPADWQQHEMVEFLLDSHWSVASGRTSALDAQAALHSTSWLPLANGTWDAFVYLSAVRVHDDVAVTEQWPDAVPIGSKEFAKIGPQPHHSAIDPPTGITWGHVAKHAERHYRLLTNPAGEAYNQTIAAAIADMNGPEPGSSWFALHLSRLKGAPAGNMLELVASGHAA